jgi:hypothetical protein
MYLDSSESGKLSLGLVSERLEQIKTVEEKNRKGILETEEPAYHLCLEDWLLSW